MNLPLIAATATVSLVLACGARDTESLAAGVSADAAGAVDAHADRATSDAGGTLDAHAAVDAGHAAATIACGAIRDCARAEVCAISHDGQAACHRRGDEPSFEHGTPSEHWPAVLLYCDGDEDCAGGSRCVLSVGEIARAVCMEEGEHCTVHVGHLCQSDADCHGCSGDRETTCRPFHQPGTSLSVCGWW